MALMHHVVKGKGAPPLVFVHGFSCDHTDWAKQVAHFSPRHLTVAVDLKGHGRTPGQPEDCNPPAFGADVAALMRELDLKGAIIVGHSMGCRVVVEAALAAPDRTAGVVMIDGSQFNHETDTLMRAKIAAGEMPAMIGAMFTSMFNAKSSAKDREAIVARAKRLPAAIADQQTLSTITYDINRAEASLAALGKPLMVIQSTFTNPQRERQEMKKGQSVPYLEMVRRQAKGARIEVIEGTGHFTQIDAPTETNALIESFIASMT